LLLDDSAQGLTATLEALSQPSQLRSDASAPGPRSPGAGDTMSPIPAAPAPAVPRSDEGSDGGLFGTPNLFPDTPQLGRSGHPQSAPTLQPLQSVGAPSHDLSRQHNIIMSQSVGLPGHDLSRQQNIRQQQEILRQQEQRLVQQQQQAQVK
jgi:hypothetical protein